MHSTHGAVQLQRQVQIQYTGDTRFFVRGKQHDGSITRIFRKAQMAGYDAILRRYILRVLNPKTFNKGTFNIVRGSRRSNYGRLSEVRDVTATCPSIGSEMVARASATRLASNLACSWPKFKNFLRFLGHVPCTQRNGLQRRHRGVQPLL